MLNPGLLTLLQSCWSSLLMLSWLKKKMLAVSTVLCKETSTKQNDKRKKKKKKEKLRICKLASYLKISLNKQGTFP